VGAIASKSVEMSKQEEESLDGGGEKRTRNNCAPLPEGTKGEGVRSISEKGGTGIM